MGVMCHTCTDHKVSATVPLRLVIKPKIVKEALQWRFERRAQVEGYVVTSVKPNKRSEPTMQYTSFL